MSRASSHSLIGALGAGILLGLAAPMGAAPLSSDAGAERRLSETDLALSDPRSGLLPRGSLESIQGQLASGRSGAGDVQNFDFSQLRDPATGRVGGSLQDTLRSFITIRKNNGPAVAGAPRANSRQPSDGLGIDLGFTPNEWVQGVMSSVLSLNVNERGQTSFAVLGFGEFSVILSGDRSEIALVSGDDILASMRRAGHETQEEGGWSSGEGPLESAPGTSDNRGAGSADSLESLLQQMLRSLFDVLAHPLSFIVYALLGGYALIWGIHSSRVHRHRHGHHRSHRPEPMPYLRPAVAAAPAAPKKVKKRLRVRVRVRKYR